MSYVVSISGSLLKSSSGSYVASSDTTFLTLATYTAAGVIGTAYNSTPASTGTAPKAFTLVQGTLPTGLSLNATTGALTGTPNVAGKYTFDVQLIDNVGATQITQSVVIITSAPVAGSGIYKIIPAQTHDVLYVSLVDVNNPTTVSVKIPNPFIETALFGDES